MDLTKLHQLTRNFIVVLNYKGVITDLIPMQALPLDYNSNELIGSKFSSYLFKSELKKFNLQFKNLKVNKVQKVDYLLKTKKNKLEWYKLSLLKNKTHYIIYCNEIDEYKIKESNEAFKLLADLAPIPIIGFEYPSLTLNYSNQSVKKDIGFHYSEIQDFKTWHKRILFAGKDDMKQKGKERQEYLEKMIKGAFADGDPLRRSIITKNGIAKRFEINFSTLSKTQIYAFFHDVTDQTNAKIILKENEEKIRNLIENLAVPILSFDLETNSIFANQKQTALIKHILPKIKKIDDFLKYIIPNSFQPNAKQLLLHSIKELKKSKPTFSQQQIDNEFDLLCADNKQRTFKIKSTIINKTLVLIFKDITDERFAFKLLKESEKNFKALAKNMPTAIGAYDINEKIIFLNKHFTKLTGYSTKDIPTLKDWYKKSQPDLKIRKELYNYWTNLLTEHKNGITKNNPELIRKVKCKNGTFKYLKFLFSISDDTFYVQTIDVTNETLAKKELEKSHEQLRLLTGSLQVEIEKERKYISREIHDELGQQITSIKMQISNLWKKIKNEKFEIDYRTVLTSIDNSIKTVRNISTKLRPSILDDLGLQAALEWLIKDFTHTTQTQFSFKYQIDETKLDKETQLHFFRIIQESLTNIKRHANATKVSVNLTNSKEQICLSIKDNGNGFNINEPTRSMGITLMKERILAIKGTFSLNSILTKGTTIKICIPK